MKAGAWRVGEDKAGVRLDRAVAVHLDLPRNQNSGLVQAMKILKNIKGIDFITLDIRDVVRHKLVTRIINAYEKKE